jgi:hypothetical protein
MRLQFSNLQMSCGSSSACHAAPVWHVMRLQFGIAVVSIALLLGRVKTKIFVLVFPREVFISFENTNLIANTFAKTLLDIVILCNFNMLMKRVSLGLKRKPLFQAKISENSLNFCKIAFCKNFRFRQCFGAGYVSWIRIRIPN